MTRSRPKAEMPFSKPVDVTPAQAFEAYASMEKPTMLGTVRILNDAGHVISMGTINRWAKRHGWKERIERQRVAMAMEPDGEDLCRVLRIEAEWVTPELIKGLQQRMVAKMARQIDALKFETPEDLARMIEVFDHMDAIIHRHRGEAIAGRGNGSSPILLDAFRTWGNGATPTHEVKQ